MSSNLCCCSPCRPTFRKHVDNIYPSVPEEGLVQTKMDTLVYYAARSPEKLDRIGEYLEQRISRDIYRNRRGYVFIGMEAMDQLIKSCHINTINLFAESFLKTVQKLLESPDPELQILASQSFKKFSEIKEDAPSYHRSYNFFIERFSQMCHSDYNDAVLRRELRLSGLQGLNGVIRKTVNEDLAENIWDPKHMEKIVPSLLYNIDPAQLEGRGDRETPDLGASIGDEKSPCWVADEILRELVQSASFGSIKAILRPVLQFMKDHDLWDESGHQRATHTFEAIMYSIHMDLSYKVIDKLMSELDLPTNSLVQKASIAIVLSKIIGIGVGDSTVGPAVLEIINDLLKQLKKSAEKEKTYDQSSSNPKQLLQHALLDALGQYASKMPDFQMIEIMTFILSKVPHDSRADHEQQLILMKALFCVAEKHTPTLFSTTFSPQLLTTLMRLLQAPDQDVRLLVLQTFQILVDRHSNREKLAKPTLEPRNMALEGYPNKFNRSDQIFVQKSLFNVFQHFKRVLEEQSNTIEFIEAIYTTCALLHIETSATDESALYLLDLIESVQGIAIKNMNLSTENRFALHAIAICFLSLLATTVQSTELDVYLDGIVQSRDAKAPHMLPPLSEEYHPGLDPNTPEEDILIDSIQVKEALKNAGKDVQRMDSLPRRKSPSRNSWPEQREQYLNSNSSSRRPSTISSESINGVDYHSACSSPGIIRKPFSEDVSIAAFKKVLEGPSQVEKEAEIARKKEMQQIYLNATLEEIMIKTAKDGPELRDLLNDVFSRVSFSEILPLTMNGHRDLEEVHEHPRKKSIMVCRDPYNQLFPELFMY